MDIKYTPILRWKNGEKNCLEHLSPDVSRQIVPFVEVSPPTDSSTDEAAEKKLSKLFFQCKLDKQAILLVLIR